MLAEESAACPHCGSADVQAFQGLDSSPRDVPSVGPNRPAARSVSRRGGSYEADEYVEPSVSDYGHARFVSSVLVVAAWSNLVPCIFLAIWMLTQERMGLLFAVPTALTGVVAYVVLSAISNLLQIACDVGRSTALSAAALTHLARRRGGQ